MCTLELPGEGQVWLAAHGRFSERAVLLGRSDLLTTCITSGMQVPGMQPDAGAPQGAHTARQMTGTAHLLDIVLHLSCRPVYSSLYSGKGSQ